MPSQPDDEYVTSSVKSLVLFSILVLSLTQERVRFNTYAGVFSLFLQVLSDSLDANARHATLIARTFSTALKYVQNKLQQTMNTSVHIDGPVHAVQYAVRVSDCRLPRTASFTTLCTQHRP